MQDDRAGCSGSCDLFGGGQDFVRRHLIAFGEGIGGAKSAIEAFVCADVGKFEDGADGDGFAAMLAAHGVGVRIERGQIGPCGTKQRQQLVTRRKFCRSDHGVLSLEAQDASL